jgi:UDP-N-acetylglucosamine:LPS N-acetylglucosamine transferase
VANKTRTNKSILALSSGGGHWFELLRLKPAFEAHDVRWVCTDDDYRADVDGAEFHVVTDGNRNQKLALLVTVAQITWLLMRHRPDVVVSTGAAPGYLAIRLASILRIHTVWVDSIANAGELSMSGSKVGPYADLWLTQIPALAQPNGPRYLGAVL